MKKSFAFIFALLLFLVGCVGLQRDTYKNN